MAEALTIARPYAEAAFKLAQDAKALPAWSELLEKLTMIVGSDSAAPLVGSPSLSPDQVAGILADTAGDLTDDQRRFVGVITENGRLDVMAEVSEHFSRLRNAHEGALDTVVQSAFELSESQTASIKATLEAKYGRAVNMQVELAPELIGGVSIRVGDEVMDASVRGKLSQLAGALKV